MRPRVPRVTTVGMEIVAHGLWAGTNAEKEIWNGIRDSSLIGVDSTNLGARVQNRSTLMTIALNTGLPCGKDRRGGS